jgi:hypothetical protein
VDILRGLLDKLKDIVKASKKVHHYSAKSMMAFNHVWYNEIFHNNMFIIANLPNTHILYSAFDVPNFIKSIEQSMTDYGITFFERTKKLSAQLDSASNSRQASQFFDRLKERIEHFSLQPYHGLDSVID